VGDRINADELKAGKKNGVSFPDIPLSTPKFDNGNYRLNQQQK
jgi:hypothetical protein